MQSNLIFGIFLLLVIALAGGLLVKFLRLQPIIGYIIAGILLGSLIPISYGESMRLAEIGAILLLFSVGLELSLARLKRVFKIAVLGGLLQILITSLVLFLIFTVLRFDIKVALIFSLGFSLSSTALVVKLLSDRGEIDTIHGEIMVGWLLVQDLFVIPIMIIIPQLAVAGSNWLTDSAGALAKALGVITAVILLGKIIAPFIIHKIASVNSRELLIISAIALALGTALLTSLFGISGALGAFLAGVVISETQENHAVFAETRPLRDLFAALFFVTLGFLVNIQVLYSNFALILSVVVLIIIMKFLIFFVINHIFGYHGRTAFQSSMGMTQVGEFSFIIFLLAGNLGIFSGNDTSIGILIALISIITTPILYKMTVPFWRRLNESTIKIPALNKLISGWDRKSPIKLSEYKDHVIICGFGRMGSWIGKAMESIKMPYVVVDYNQTVVNKAKKGGIEVFYGDPSEMEVLGQAGISKARYLVVTIPDRITQEELITKVQTLYPRIKIYSRAHFDEDIERLKFLRVEKVVQPEFEAALTVMKSILSNLGKSREEIAGLSRSLRQSKSMMK